MYTPIPNNKQTNKQTNDAGETTVETIFEDDARECSMTLLLAKGRGAGGGNEELSATAGVGDEGGVVMDRAAVMGVAAAHVGDDEVMGVVTSAERRIEGGEGAGGVSAVALLTDTRDSMPATLDGDGDVGGDKKKRRKGQKQRICAALLQKGSCDKGEGCPFRHRK